MLETRAISLLLLCLPVRFLNASRVLRNPLRRILHEAIWLGHCYLFSVLEHSDYLASGQQGGTRCRNVAALSMRRIASPKLRPVVNWFHLNASGNGIQMYESSIFWKGERWPQPIPEREKGVFFRIGSPRKNVFCYDTDSC